MSTVRLAHLFWIEKTNATFTLIAQALASEMAPDTRVNCVAPGFVPTHFADFLTKNEDMVSFCFPFMNYK